MRSMRRVRAMWSTSEMLRAPRSCCWMLAISALVRERVMVAGFLSGKMGLLADAAAHHVHRRAPQDLDRFVVPPLDLCFQRRGRDDAALVLDRLAVTHAVREVAVGRNVRVRERHWLVF